MLTVFNKKVLFYSKILNGKYYTSQNNKKDNQ
jgi:hypothetical protein